MTRAWRAKRPASHFRVYVELVGSQQKVLLVDDSELTLRVVAKVLVEHGYDVRTTTSVDGLVAELGTWRPEVILTDVDMPGISGVDLCRRLKSTYDTAHVPVVLFSALPHAELELLARQCDADGFLCKSGLEDLPGELALLFDTLMF
jgi:CheY-like chemotaxis protein